jgi:hypothetical protein
MKTKKALISRASQQGLGFAFWFCIGCLGSPNLAAQPLRSMSEVVSHADSLLTYADYRTAQDQYEQNHWQDAFSMFAGLANHNHRRSAQVACHMWKYGGVLYKTDFSASEEQILRWCALSNQAAQ